MNDKTKTWQFRFKTSTKIHTYTHTLLGQKKPRDKFRTQKEKLYNANKMYYCIHLYHTQIPIFTLVAVSVIIFFSFSHFFFSLHLSSSKLFFGFGDSFSSSSYYSCFKYTFIHLYYYCVL